MSTVQTLQSTGECSPLSRPFHSSVCVRHDRLSDRYIPYGAFIAEYSSEGRWVRQQRLALTREEKIKILSAIDENNKEENRTYRYNFFFDNCTTRARDMIIRNLGQHITDFKDVDAQSTYRKEIHRLNGNHKWARFGNDLLLGFMADRPISKQEWEFLPENLSKDFATEARKDTTVQKTMAEVYPTKKDISN